MNELKEKLIREFKRDWRRSGVLVVLTIVGVVMAIRQFGGGSPEPASATSTRTSSNRLAPAPSNGWAPPPAPASAPPVKLDEIELRPRVYAPPRRDPFAVDLTRFPADPDAGAKGGTKVSLTDSAQESERAAQEARRAAMAAVETDARNLVLQTVLMASPPRAMIGGEIYQVGQRVNGFLVTRIGSASVTLERDGFEVMLKME